MGWKEYQRRNYRNKAMVFKKKQKQPLFLLLIFFLVIMGIYCYNSYISIAFNKVFTYKKTIQKKPIHSFTQGKEFSLASFKQTLDNKMAVSMGQGKEGISTLIPSLQKEAVNLFQQYKIPVASFVAIDPSTGAVLGMASHNEASPSNDFSLILSAKYPAASIFKLITLSAALENGIIEPNDTLEATGRLRCGPKSIKDASNVHPGLITVANALAQSCNTAFGKIALDVGRSRLMEYGTRFGFNSKLFFDLKAEVSPATICNNPFDIAASGAGFGNINMSPLHGALIAATIANNGKMMRPYLFEKIVDEQGRTLMRHQPQVMRNPINPSTAEIIKAMMIKTVHGRGTARNAFYDGRGRAYIPGVTIAAKTGSLSCNPSSKNDSSPKNCTWFVGFAPADDPKIAMAVMVVNHDIWRAKASTVARRLLQTYFEDKERS